MIMFTYFGPPTFNFVTEKFSANMLFNDGTLNFYEVSICKINDSCITTSIHSLNSCDELGENSLRMLINRLS